MRENDEFIQLRANQRNIFAPHYYQQSSKRWLDVVEGDRASIRGEDYEAVWAQIKRTFRDQRLWIYNAVSSGYFHFFFFFCFGCTLIGTALKFNAWTYVNGLGAVLQFYNYCANGYKRQHRHVMDILKVKLFLLHLFLWRHPTVNTSPAILSIYLSRSLTQLLLRTEPHQAKKKV